MTLVFGVAATGIALGAYYVLIALGLYITYAGTRVINFAQGAVAALGGLTFYALTVTHGLDRWLALPVVALLGFLAGSVMHLSLTPFMRRPDAFWAAGIATIGLSFVLEGIMLLRFGASTFISEPFVAGGPWILGDVAIPRQQVVVFVGAALATASLYALFQHTRIGLMLRANAASHEGAQVVGLHVTQLGAMVFGLAGALSAIAGALASPLLGTNFENGQVSLFVAFTALVLGGMGSAAAAAMGAFALALIQSVVAATPIGQFGNVALFAVLVLVLVVRPAGLARVRA